MTLLDSAHPLTARRSSLRIVVIGLTITSSWGNGHATTYRGLLRELSRLGHTVLFLECDKPWYAGNRDFARSSDFEIELYTDLADLSERFGSEVAGADVVILGSYVPDGIAVAEWVMHRARGVKAFYDIDTPVTLAALERGECEYVSATLIPQFDGYFSFAGGRALERLEHRFRARRAIALYCNVDADHYHPEHRACRWSLGYLGTFSPDRQPALERLLLEPARQLPRQQFVVAGPQYPAGVGWNNVARIEHLPPSEHRAFYNSQMFTLNITRQDMIALGHSPSVRLFEAAACGVPIISDRWDGIEEFFTPSEEILLAGSTEDVVRILTTLAPDHRRRIGEQARKRVLAAHTAAHRAAELGAHLSEMMSVI
jgi:spore maturation protein CgeB